MIKKRIITYLIIFNLLVILIILLGKIVILRELINVLASVVMIPIVFGVFLFYILKPLNRIFLKKKLNRGRAAGLTLIIFLFIASGIIAYFSDYFINQMNNLKSLFLSIMEQNGMGGNIEDLIAKNMSNAEYYNRILSDIHKYSSTVLTTVRQTLNTGMKLFSNLLLVLLIAFYLLKDEKEIRENIVKIFPKKYQDRISDIVHESDDNLSLYIMGQLKVATALALMVFVGYKIIGMTSPLLLSSLTFILAFIPFIGFFISMIFPFIIAISIGWNMIVKLLVLIVIAQALKGRIVVPLIMGRTMKIHPIMNIFLVVASAALFGPIGAFIAVPLYSILRIIFKYFNKDLSKKIKEITHE